MLTFISRTSQGVAVHRDFGAHSLLCAPTVAQIFADPTKHEGKEYMMVGTYRRQDESARGGGSGCIGYGVYFEYFCGTDMGCAEGDARHDSAA